MLSDNQTREVIGATADGSGRDKIGKVGQLFLEDETGQPGFVTVTTGFFGSSESHRGGGRRRPALIWGRTAGGPLLPAEAGLAELS
jgi:hypothetical protein